MAKPRQQAPNTNATSAGGLQQQTLEDNLYDLAYDYKDWVNFWFPQATDAEIARAFEKFQADLRTNVESQLHHPLDASAVGMADEAFQLRAQGTGRVEIGNWVYDYQEAKKYFRVNTNDLPDQYSRDGDFIDEVLKGLTQQGRYDPERAQWLTDHKAEFLGRYLDDPTAQGMGFSHYLLSRLGDKPEAFADTVFQLSQLTPEQRRQARASLVYSAREGQVYDALKKQGIDLQQLAQTDPAYAQAVQKSVQDFLGSVTDHEKQQMVVGNSYDLSADLEGFLAQLPQQQGFDANYLRSDQGQAGAMDQLTRYAVQKGYLRSDMSPEDKNAALDAIKTAYADAQLKALEAENAGQTVDFQNILRQALDAQPHTAADVQAKGQLDALTKQQKAVADANALAQKPATDYTNQISTSLSKLWGETPATDAQVAGAQNFVNYVRGSGGGGPPAPPSTPGEQRASYADQLKREQALQQQGHSFLTQGLLANQYGLGYASGSNDGENLAVNTTFQDYLLGKESEITAGFQQYARDKGNEWLSSNPDTPSWAIPHVYSTRLEDPNLFNSYLNEKMNGYKQDFTSRVLPDMQLKMKQQRDVNALSTQKQGAQPSRTVFRY